MRKTSKKMQDGGAKCDHCRPLKVTATWKEGGFRAGLACDKHKDLLSSEELDDGRLTEADYQTWVKL